MCDLWNVDSEHEITNSRQAPKRGPVLNYNCKRLEMRFNMGKKYLSCILVFFILLALSSCKTVSHQNNDEETESQILHEEIESQTLHEETESQTLHEVLLEYPIKMPYIAIKFAITISHFPASAKYCNISSFCGGLPVKKISLDDGNQFEYYFPSSEESFDFDKVVLEFYDENEQLVADANILIKYDDKSREYIITEQLFKQT